MWNLSSFQREGDVNLRACILLFVVLALQVDAISWADLPDASSSDGGSRRPQPEVPDDIRRLIFELHSREPSQRLRAATVLSSRGAAAHAAQTHLRAQLDASESHVHRIVYAQALVIVSGAPVGFEVLERELSNRREEVRLFAVAAALDVLDHYSDVPVSNRSRTWKSLTELKSGLQVAVSAARSGSHTETDGPTLDEVPSLDDAERGTAEQGTANRQRVDRTQSGAHGGAESIQVAHVVPGAVPDLGVDRQKMFAPPADRVAKHPQLIPPAPAATPPQFLKAVPPAPPQFLKAVPPAPLQFLKAVPPAPRAPSDDVPRDPLFKRIDELTVKTTYVNAAQSPLPDFAQGGYFGSQPQRLLGSGNEQAWQGYVASSQRYRHRHQPLYFEDVSLERCGESCGVAQPITSSAKFAGSVLTLPFRVGTQPWCSTVVTDPDCCDECYLPCSSHGAALQAIATAGLIFIIP